ncbi:MAG: M48 family metalloprotease [Acidobacteriia bacterium]|nr:M48 family metalloprotease [Terriglobia bacterium]
MQSPARVCLMLMGLIVATSLASAPRAQQPAPAGATMSADEVVDRITKAEAALTARMRAYHPLVEVYIQNLAPDPKLGTVPTHDDYFLGQFEGKDGPNLIPLSPSKGSFHPASLLARPFNVQYLPAGFAATTVPDWRLIDRERYEFAFIRREFLGEARTIVLDIHPKSGSADGFTGRIWVEDRDFNIVRFNGISRNIDHTLSSFFRKKLSFHVDSWRVNVLPGLWLPAYVYCEETDLSDRPALPRMPRIKSQVRLWGYELKGTAVQSEFTSILLDAPTVQDSSDQTKQLSPVQSQRRWEQQAEDNVLDRLSRAGFLAPAGRVDAVLETVLNNLEVTNNLTIDPPLKCRVLLTAPLESFTVGHTIVLSRGLIDVLPDEASLAMVLGHELSHALLGHQLIDTKFAFADRLMVPDSELLGTLRFRHPSSEESAADTKVVELLSKSPYKDKLADAGLFLRAVAANAKALTNLIQPHMGDFIIEGGQPLGVLMQKAPELAPEKLDQIAALPLGARLVVDPWSDRLELLRTPSVPLTSAREKVPLAITPLMPYIRYAEAPARTTAQQD